MYLVGLEVLEFSASQGKYIPQCSFVTPHLLLINPSSTPHQLFTYTIIFTFTCTEFMGGLPPLKMQGSICSFLSMLDFVLGCFMRLFVHIMPFSLLTFYTAVSCNLALAAPL